MVTEFAPHLPNGQVPGAAPGRVAEIRIGGEVDFPEGKMVPVLLGKRRFLVVRVQGGLFAIDDRCNHAAGPLHQGKRKDFIVECPFHMSRFDLRTGKLVSKGPAVRDQGTAIVRARGGEVFLDLPPDEAITAK